MDAFIKIERFFFENARIITIYGLIVSAVLESVILFLYSKIETQYKTIGIIKKSIELQYKYGVFNSLAPKLAIFILFAYPKMPRYPQFLFFLLFAIHTLVAAFNLSQAWIGKLRRRGA